MQVLRLLRRRTDSYREKLGNCREKFGSSTGNVYKVLNINKKGINAGRGPGADAFVVFVSLGGRGGCYRLALISYSPFGDVTLMKSCFQSFQSLVISHFQNLM